MSLFESDSGVITYKFAPVRTRWRWCVLAFALALIALVGVAAMVLT